MVPMVEMVINSGGEEVLLKLLTDGGYVYRLR